LARLLDAPAEPVARWRRIASALPAFAAAALSGAALLGLPFPGTTRGALCHVVAVEFLVIHSFPFLSMITLPRVRTRRWRAYQWFLFATWSCLYLGFAGEGRHGWSGILDFASGAIATYLGFLLRWGSGNRVAALVKRWAASFLFFVVAAVLTGARDFGDSDATLLHGALYFAALGLAEACGLHDLDWRNALRRRHGRPRVPAEPVGR
ncbi:MAG: hypothetical protein L6Q95_08650, partial [Planctomycetes bacterium]|nr:hypothetical protein [Planctomycetota bacterium]